MAEERPETSSLTAHRLVAGSLGIAAKVPEDVLKHEREKIANAKGRCNKMLINLFELFYLKKIY